MITSAKEYLAHLQEIRNANLHTEVLNIPADETVYYIDLNARTIDTPEFLSVETDHVAETVFFCVDRYFDNFDLAQSTCLIQYINANGDGYVYVAPIYDLETYAEEGKMLIPWVIQGNATIASGTIRYAVRFYKLHKTEGLDGNNQYNFDYIVNTQMAQSKILKGMGTGYLDPATSSIEEVAPASAWEELYQNLVDLMNPESENYQALHLY